MLKIRYENTFKKDYKKIIKRGYDIKKLQLILKLIMEEIQLPKKYKDHYLIGNYKNCKECHIEPDWLLIYRISNSNLILIRTGSHSDLF